MRLLKFGFTTLNIERAIRIDDNGTYVSVDFVPADNTMLPLNIRFEGKEAAALRLWIARNAEDMSDFDPESTGDPLGPPKPYASSR